MHQWFRLNGLPMSRVLTQTSEAARESLYHSASLVGLAPMSVSDLALSSSAGRFGIRPIPCGLADEPPPETARTYGTDKITMIAYEG